LEKYLKGERTPECDDIFKEYQACVIKVLHAKGLDSVVAKAKRDFDNDLEQSHAKK
jgi:TRIAP1/MDM35 family protein